MMNIDIAMVIKKVKPFVESHLVILNTIRNVLNGTVWRDTHKRLKRFIENKDLILDIGSLSAPFTKYLPNQTVAIDLPRRGGEGFSKETLAELKSKKNVNPLFANGEALPFKDRSFDKIICTEVIEHIYNDESAVSEMARVLKENGKAFLTTPNGDVVPLESGIKTHVRHYSERGLKHLLSKYFKDVELGKRFRFRSLLNVQYRLGDAWSKNRSHVWLYFMRLIASWMYDGVWLVVKLIGGNYNFVVICSGPIKNE